MVSHSRGGTQLAVHEPRFTAHESAFRLVFAIPDQLLKRPKISVKMAIPEETVLTDKRTADSTDNIAEAMKRVTG